MRWEDSDVSLMNAERKQDIIALTALVVGSMIAGGVFGRPPGQ